MKIYFLGLVRFLGVLTSFYIFLYFSANLPIHYTILSRLFLTAVMFISFIAVTGTLNTGSLPRVPQKRTLKYLFISIAVVIQLTLLLIAYTNNKYNNVDFSKELGENVRNGNSIIDFQKITNFNWDSMYLFGPYEPRSTICDALRVQVKYCEKIISFESIDDGDMSIAFLREGRLIRYVRHARYNGDFMPLPQKQPIPSSHAKFRVVTTTENASDGKPWLKLILDK